MECIYLFNFSQTKQNLTYRLYEGVLNQQIIKDPNRIPVYRDLAMIYHRRGKYEKAIEAYEKTAEVSPFSSKYDHFLRGDVELSAQEMHGLTLFEAEEKGNCAACHPSQPGDDGSPPLFTDFTYDNLGTPRNPENPFYIVPKELNPDGLDFVDLGLGAILDDSSENGKFRVPTLRNVAVTGPYMHNGVFKTMFEVLAFYNTRDIIDWPNPEVRANVNREELGNLGLTNEELEDLVAFLRTLTDGWNPSASE